MAMNRYSHLPVLLLAVAALAAVGVNVANAEDRKLTPEQLETLRSLGYIQ